MDKVTTSAGAFHLNQVLLMKSKVNVAVAEIIKNSFTGDTFLDLETGFSLHVINGVRLPADLQSSWTWDGACNFGPISFYSKYVMFVFTILIRIKLHFYNKILNVKQLFS